MNHSDPDPHLKKYLDAEGKWKGQTQCVCQDCKDRRNRENPES